MSESTMGQVKTDDLISRRAAIDAIKRNESADSYDLNNGLILAMNAVADVPTIESKKVVEDYCRPRNLMVVAAEDFHRLVEQMLQTIDVPDRKFGEWMAEPNCWYRCSNCGQHYPSIRGYMDYNYCPNCGAMMDVADNDVGKMCEVSDEHTA